jgi:methionyl aminopeptidase
LKITIKTKKEIETMKKGGEILAEIVRHLSDFAQIGMSTLDIDTEARVLLKKYDVDSAFLGYQGYPAVTCLGINDTAVHGIPDEKEVMKEGDILTIDMGIIFNGLYLDHAVSKAMGTISSERRKLLDTTKQALKEAIKKAHAGKRVGDISHAIQEVAESNGFSVVTQMTGHGVGYAMHEPPQIPCFGQKGTGEVLEEGMTIAIEPMLVNGNSKLKFMDNGWTTKVIDGSDFAIFEHTIAVGQQKSEILTK